jgi:hypothetical protein
VSAENSTAKAFPDNKKTNNKTAKYFLNIKNSLFIS